MNLKTIYYKVYKKDKIKIQKYLFKKYNAKWTSQQYDGAAQVIEIKIKTNYFFIAVTKYNYGTLLKYYNGKKNVESFDYKYIDFRNILRKKKINNILKY